MHSDFGQLISAEDGDILSIAWVLLIGVIWQDYPGHCYRRCHMSFQAARFHEGAVEQQCLHMCGVYLIIPCMDAILGEVAQYEASEWGHWRMAHSKAFS